MLMGLATIYKNKHTPILRIPKAVCDDSKFPYDLSSSKKVIVQIVKQGLLIREATEQDAVEIQRKKFRLSDILANRPTNNDQ